MKAQSYPSAAPVKMPEWRIVQHSQEWLFYICASRMDIPMKAASRDLSERRLHFELLTRAIYCICPVLRSSSCVPLSK